MPGRSRLSIAKADIVRVFRDRTARVYSRADIEMVLSVNRAFWRLAASTTVNAFLEFLLRNTDLRAIKVDFPNRPVVRYTWGEVPVFALVQSIKPNGYFTHYSALHLHGLTVQVPKTIYLNHEQAASGGDGELKQTAIDYAFRRKCRVSTNVGAFAAHQVCLVNGRNTGCLGVTEFETEDRSRLRVTDLERTLIDATVRPVYSGGIFEVARAFEMASDRLSVNKLAATLRKLRFTYPYHQAIGFYLERSGVYRNSQIDLLREFPMNFDFYLTHEMKNPDYNPKWRLFVPKGF